MAPEPSGSPVSPGPIRVSAATGLGMAALRQAIARSLGRRGASVAGSMLILQPRHAAALAGVTQHLAAARERLAGHLSEHSLPGIEFIASAMRGALDDLACLGGDATPDDVIGQVFQAFCVGK